eukprot:179504_1
MSNNDHHMVKENWLLKKSKHIGVWRERWTVLTTDALSCYKQEKVYKNPTTIIKLSSIKQIVSVSEWIFNITKHNKEITSFQWKSEPVATQWKKDIEYAMHLIEIPISVICKNNSKFSCQFSIVLHYHKDSDYTLQKMINKITIYLIGKYDYTDFLPIRVLSSSYLMTEIHLNDTELNNDNFKMTNYSKNIIITKGIKLEIIAIKPYSCNEIVFPQTPNICRFRTETIFEKIKCVTPKQKYIICGFIRQLQLINLFDSIPNELLLLMCIFIDYTEEYSIDNFTLLRCGQSNITLGQSVTYYYENKIVLQKQTQNMFLMKCFKKRNIFGRNIVHNVKRERRILGHLNHPFILKLHYAFQTDYKLYMVMDFCHGGDISFYLDKAGRFTEEKTRFYMAEIVLAVGYLHSKNIIHRNLKPENILLDKYGHIKIHDFSLSQDNVSNNSLVYDFCGTPEYLCPEIVRKIGHGFPVDWWSIGCLMYELLCGMPPFYSRNRDRLFEKILRQKVRFPNYFSVESIDIIKQLLNRNPKYRLGSRYGVEEIKKHMFWKDLNWKLLAEREIKPPFVPIVSKWNYDDEPTGFPLEYHEENKRKYAPFDDFEFDGNVQIFI